MVQVQCIIRKPAENCLLAEHNLTPRELLFMVAMCILAAMAFNAWLFTVVLAAYRYLRNEQIDYARLPTTTVSQSSG